MQWLATAATLTFAVPVQGAQNDPRLDPLFAELAAAQTPEDAAPIEQTIWKIWLLSGNGAVDADMLRGLQAMGAGDNETALEHFTRVVEATPDFAEGWNKRATVNYLLGRFDASGHRYSENAGAGTPPFRRAVRPCSDQPCARPRTRSPQGVRGGDAGPPQSAGARGPISANCARKSAARGSSPARSLINPRPRRSGECSLRPGCKGYARRDHQPVAFPGQFFAERDAAGLADHVREILTSRVITPWTPQASTSRRAVAVLSVRHSIGTTGRSRAARRVVEPDVV